MFKGLTKKEVNKTVRYSSKKEDDEDKKKSSAKDSLRTKETSSGGKNKSDSTGTKRQSAKANRSGNKRRLSDTQRQYQEEQYKTKAVPQAIARLTEKAINDVALAPVSIPYQIATGKKLVDMGLEPTTKSAEVGAAVGNIAGNILSYGTGYKAAEKAVGKAASKALATKTGQKAVEKAVSSKVGKKVGEKTIKKVAESATKSAIADATVGTTLNLSHARGEGLEGKELAQDMALNAALDLGMGGAIEALHIAKALVNSGKTTAKEATQQAAKDTLRKASESTQTAEKSVNAELPTKATKTAESSPKTTKEKQKAARKQKRAAAEATAAEREVVSEEIGSYVDAIKPTNQKSKVRASRGIVTIKSDRGFEAYMADTYGDIYAIENRAAKSGESFDDFVRTEYNNYQYAPDDIKANYKESGITIGDIDKPTGEIADSERKLFANYLQKKYGALDNAKQVADSQGMDLQTFFKKEKVEYDQMQAKETLKSFYSAKAANPQSTLNSKLKDLGADTARQNTSDIPQSLKQEQPEISINSKGEETKVAGFDVVGDNTVGIVSPGTQTYQEAMEKSTGLFKRAYKMFVNATSEIDNLSKAAGDNKALNSLQAVKTANGTSDYIFNKHLVNPQGDIIDERSFVDVFKPISENSKEFNEYAQHLNNISRWAEGKPLDQNISAEESQRIVNEMLQKHPEFADMTNELNSYWQKFTHSWFVDAGRMTENAWQAMVTKYPNYVPAFMPEKGVNIGGSRFSVNSGTKSAKAGNTLSRVPVEDAMMQQIQRIVNTTRKNDLYLNTIDILRSNPDELKHFGIVNTDKQIIDNLDFDTIISESEKDSLKEVGSGRYTISAMENGQKVTAYINADLAEAFAKIDNVIGSTNMQGFANIGKKITNWMKGAITVYNPVFSVANISRDIPSALIQTENGTMRYTKNLFKAVEEMATNGEMWNKYLAMGGKSSGYVGSNRTFRNTLLPTKNPVKNVFESIKNVLGSAGEATESIPRFAEFLSTMETTNDLNKALRDSARVTTDFTNAGEVGKVLDAWTLYLNAGIQGLDTFAKMLKNHPIRTIARATSVITVPYALLTLYNWSNPHYQDLTEHTQQNYFCIPNLAGETDDDGNAKTFIRIPLNREYGAIFGSAIDVVAGYLSGEANPWDGYANTLQNNFMTADPASENILAPLLINLPNNKDYAGRLIVPQSLENVSPELQYDSSTSGLAKGISKVANNLNIPSDTLKSPMKVDYLLDSYTGYLGQVGQAATDQSIEGLGEKLKGVTIDPFIDRFTVDPRYSSGAMSDFYTAKEEAEKAYNDVKLTTGEKGEEYIRNKTYTAIQSELSDLAKEEKSILADTSLSAKEKSEKSKEIRKQKNEIAREAEKRVEEAVKEYNENPNYTLLTTQQKESYEKNYADVMSKEEYANAKNLISDAEVTSDVAKAYVLLENGTTIRDLEVAIAMTSSNAVEKVAEYKKAGITLEDVQEASQIVKDSGYTKSVGKAYALLAGGASQTTAELMTSEKAVQRAIWLRQANVTPEQLDGVADMIDTNGNGSYTVDEIKSFFNNHSSQFTTAQKRAIFLALSSAKNSPY